MQISKYIHYIEASFYTKRAANKTCSRENIIFFKNASQRKTVKFTVNNKIAPTSLLQNIHI